MRIAHSIAPSVSGDEIPARIFDYEVIDFAGEGAGSLIYVVAHPQTRQLYAIKHVRRRDDKDQRYFDQLENEFAVSQHFSHPALRRCIEVKDNHTLFHKATEAALVMELFDGTPLDSRDNGDINALLDCFLQVARGLAAMHASGYIHCDLKPNNILVGAGGQVKVIDFGQTCKAGSIKQRIQGTPHFIAPEQVRCQPITVRTDVFNLGATMYWALGRKALPTLFTLKKDKNSFLVDERITSPRELDSSVPESLSNLVMECVRTNPQRRPEDMNELARRLEVVQHVVRLRGVAGLVVMTTGQPDRPVEQIEVGPCVC